MNLEKLLGKEIDESKQGDALSIPTSDKSTKKMYLESYGCQMNFSDSEIVASILTKEGFSTTQDITEADIVFVNTCSVREKAEQTVRKRLEFYNSIKRDKNSKMLVGVLGCMAERLKAKFLEEEKLVDIVVGPWLCLFTYLAEDKLEGLQAENLKKYAKHDNVKKDLFLVIPSNTLSVINQFTYNIGDYNVYIITKDALEPIILSLKKIEEYEFADKLSPEERDNVCRIIGKFAHTTKRRIQIDQFFAEEFLDTLQKAKQLPTDILGSVIQFENAEKLNPPMEKRKKQILTKDLKEKSEEIQKEIELRDIPEITTQIKFKEDNNA